MRNGQIIVTGASRGIGAAIVEELAGRGYRIAGISRTGICTAGDGYACDVTDEAALAATIARIAEKGPITGLVNNAGAHTSKPSADLTAAEFEATMRLDATSVVVASREVRPHLIAAGGGLILNMGSFFDRLGVPHNLAYCSAKAAVAAITRCLAVEWAADGIRVLSLAPGYIATDLNKDFLAQEKVMTWLKRRIPVGRPGTAQEVARLAGLLFDADIGFLTGETITIDGGQAMNH